MGASSSKPTTQSLPCTSLSFSLPVWPLPSLRLFPSRLMLEVFSTALDTPVPLLLDTLLPQLPMPLPQLPLLSQLPMLLPSQLPPRSLSPSLPLLSPETTPLDLPAFTTPSPPRLPPMAFPQSDRLPRLPSSRTSSSLLSSGDTRLPTKQSNFHNINQS